MSIYRVDCPPEDPAVLKKLKAALEGAGAQALEVLTSDTTGVKVLLFISHDRMISLTAMQNGASSAMVF